MPLIHERQIEDADGFYEELVDAQRDLPDEEAQRVLAKLVLLLANHIGDRAVLSEAIAVAAGRNV
ncbi:MAG: DUF2783 domain-containing protein [Burkholderiales bacterium]|nr:DUF2783 domain-containing protein [Burkholderiales bacterium]